MAAGKLDVFCSARKETVNMTKMLQFGVVSHVRMNLVQAIKVQTKLMI